MRSGPTGELALRVGERVPRRRFGDAIAPKGTRAFDLAHLDKG